MTPICTWRTREKAWSDENFTLIEPLDNCCPYNQVITVVNVQVDICAYPDTVKYNEVQMIKKTKIYIYIIKNN